MTFRTFRHIALFVTIALLMLSVAVVGAQDATAAAVAHCVSPSAPRPARSTRLQTDDSEIALNRAIYDYLVEVLPDSTIGPNLASDWTISEDGLTYTFNLVQGVTFQDGSAFCSADVVWTFNRLVAQSSQALNLLGDFSISRARRQYRRLHAQNCECRFPLRCRRASDGHPQGWTGYAQRDR